MRSEPDIKSLISRVESGLPALGLTVAEFCHHIGVDRATWQRWKSGKHSPHNLAFRRVEDEFAAIVANRQTNSTAPSPLAVEAA